MERKSKNIYSLPFPKTLKIKIEKAPFHYEENWMQYAVDFCMPVGTKILAAANGTVHKVVDRNTLGGPDKTKYRKYANLIMIKHENGEYSGYCHLRKNCLVKEGQKVNKGEVIAFSDITGYCAYPHLHFQIMVPHKGGGYGGWITIPARFKIDDKIKVLRSPEK